jgi:hypothetical protein
MSPGQPSPETARLARAVPVLLVAAACLFNAVAYLSEVLVAAPDINDDVFHFGLIQRMNAAWEAGGHPLDTWIGYWGQGFPVLRYYQHLPHFVVVLAYRLLGGNVPLHTVFEGITLVLLALLPLTFYVGSRRLGASPMTAACIALCTPLLGADPTQSHFLGFQPTSFLWSGGGLFTQLAAMVVFPLALGATSRAVLEGRRYAPAIAWLGATWLSHLLLGYTACLLGVAFVLRPEARGRRLRVALRLAAIYAGVALVAAYLLLPTLLEGQWLARSIWEPAEYWHSYGAQRVLGALLTGGLLDGPRIPVLTILAALGALLAARAWFEHPRSAEGGFASVALAMFVLGLLLFFGRPTWGRLLELLPFSGQLPFHRFICAVQFGGLLLAGFALSRLADRVARWSPLQFRPAAAGIVALLVVSPAIASTAGLASRNAAWRAEAAAADAAARPALERAFADFRALEQAVPGRGYAGTSWDWGSTFKPGGAHAYHRWSRQDLPAISYMYHTMGLSSDLEPAFDPRRRDHYELFNVRYLLADLEQRLPPFAERRLAEPGLVSGLVETEGYFGIVGTAAYLPYANGEADALRAFNRAFIASNWHAERRFVRIGWRAGDAATAGERALSTGDPLDTAHPAGWQAPRGRVISSGGHGDRYHARVQLDDPGIVLFRTSYHPNWQAELDGEPADTVMLSPGYLGVRAAPGEHVIEMTYRTPGWTRTLPWMGLGFLALVALADLRRGRAARLPRRAGA